MSTWFDNYEPGTDIQTQWYIKEDAGFLGRCMHFQFPGPSSLAVALLMLGQTTYALSRHGSEGMLHFFLIGLRTQMYP